MEPLADKSAASPFFGCAAHKRLYLGGNAEAEGVSWLLVRVKGGGEPPHSKRVYVIC